MWLLEKQKGGQCSCSEVVGGMVGTDGNEGDGGRKVGLMLLVRGLGVCAEWAI